MIADLVAFKLSCFLYIPLPDSPPRALIQKREVNTVLADIIKHLTPDRAFEDAYPLVRTEQPANQTLPFQKSK